MAIHPAYPVEGCDISSHQGKMNFNIASARMSFIYIRAGSAYLPGNQEDSRFKENMRQSRGRLPRGFYYVIRLEMDIPTQMENFIEIIQTAHGELVPILDVERNDKNLSRVVFAHRLQEALAYLDRSPLLNGSSTGIYSSPGFWDANVAPGIIDTTDRTLWVANYHHDPHQVLPFPTLPQDWPYWTLWQMSDGGNGLGHEYGASSPSIDINAFAGDASAFESWFGVPPNQVKLGETAPEAPAFVITRTSVNIRDGPGVTYQKIGASIKSARWPVETIVQGQDGLWVKVTEGVFLAYWLCTPLD
jgi:GH25 family lysozyme M1 (1,4-beta-N-acetylmuramidase)